MAAAFALQSSRLLVESKSTLQLMQQLEIVDQEAGTVSPTCLSANTAKL
jgi:hypothetical protein